MDNYLNIKRILLFLPLMLGAVLGVGGCSPSSFFGKGPDQGVLQMPNYRKANSACASMDLKTSTLDVHTFRSMVGCLNATGLLNKTEQLLSKLSDQDVDPLVQFLNRYVMNDTKRLYEIEQTYNTFVSRKIHDRAFALLADVLDNKDLVANLLVLFKSSYYVPKPGKASADPKTLKLSDYTPDQNILIALKLISKKLDDHVFRESLDIGLLSARSPSFEVLERHLLSPRYSGETEKQRDDQNLQIATLLSKYLKDEHTFECTDSEGKRNIGIKTELSDLIQSNQVLPVMKQLLGGTDGQSLTAEQIKVGGPKLVSLTRGLVQSSGPSATSPVLLDRLATAFNVLGGDQAPDLVCMNGAETIPVKATRYLVRELVGFRTPSQASSYIKYEAPITLMMLAPFCKMPPGIKEQYDAMFDLVRNGLAEPMVETLSTLYQHTTELSTGTCKQNFGYAGEKRRPWIDMVMHFFADTGPKQNGGVHYLTPVISDLVTRGILADTLLIATVTNDKDGAEINDALVFLTAPQTELKGQSIFDVFLTAAGRAQPKDFFLLVKSLGSFLSYKKGFLDQILTQAREMHYVNNATPILGLLRDFGAQATVPENVKFFETLFKIVDQHEPEFLAGVQELSTRARDGNLESLIGSLVKLYHNFALKGKSDVLETQEPAFAKVARHELKELPQAPALQLELVDEGCHKLDFEFSLADVGLQDQFNKQFKHLLDCKQSSGLQNDQNIYASLSYLNDPATAVAGDTFWTYQTQQLRTFLGGFDQSAINYMIKQWLPDPSASTPQPDKLEPVVKALPYLLVGNSSPVWPLFNALKPVTDSSQIQNLEVLENLAADIIEHDRFHFPRLLADAEIVLDRTKVLKKAPISLDPTPKQQAALDSIYTPELRAVLRVWVPAVECWRPGGFSLDQNQIETRIDEIIYESQNRVTTYDLVDGKSRLGDTKTARMSWDFKVLKDQTATVLDRVKEKSVLDALFNATQGMRLPVESNPILLDSTTGSWARHSPQELLTLIHKRARRVRPRIQYFKGDQRPHVVVVSDLDLFEIALYNVDLVLKSSFGLPEKNLALQFTQEFALAWGDVDAAQWPSKIAEKYQEAVGIAKRYSTSDRRLWLKADQEKYDSVRPRTLEEAVEGIVHRPPAGQSVSMLHTAWIVAKHYSKALWRKLISSEISPVVPDDPTRDGGLEDLSTLSLQLVGLPEKQACSKNFAHDVPNMPEAIYFHDGKPPTQITGETYVSLPPELDQPDYRQPPIPKDAQSNSEIVKDLAKYYPGDGVLNMRGQLFNLWQAISVMRENYPGSEGNNDGGFLPIMRDLFYEVYFSNSSNILAEQFPSTKGDENNLMVISRAIRLGVMHQMSTLLQRFEIGDPELNDLVMSVIHAANTPQMKGLVSNLLTNHPDNELIWTLMQTVNQANAAETQRVKQLVFYLLAGLNEIEPWVPSGDGVLTEGLPDQALARANEILNQYYDFLMSGRIPLAAGDDPSQPGKLILQSFLTSNVAASASQSLYELMVRPQLDQNRQPIGPEDPHRAERWKTVLQEVLKEGRGNGDDTVAFKAVALLKAMIEDPDGKAWHALGEVSDRLDSLQNLPAYKALNVDQFFRPVLDFMEEKPPNTSDQVSTNRQLRVQLAALLRSGSSSGRSNLLNELVKLANQDPKQFNLLLKTLSDSVPNMTEFLQVIRRSLPQER